MGFTRCICVFGLMACFDLEARESLRLKTGYSLEADSHEQRDDMVVVKMGSGTLQIPVNDILEIQLLPDLPVIATKPLVKAVSAEQLLGEAALAQGIEAAFVRSVAIVESGMRQGAVSNKGALGLMQLMPATAQELKVDPLQAQGNALGGAMYLRKLLLAYKGDSGLALAAYNAGPGAVKRYRGIPPYRETRQYVLKVLREYDRQLRLMPKTAAVVAETAAVVNTTSATN